MKDAAQPVTGAYPQADLEEMGAGKRYTRWVLSGFWPWLKGDVCEVGAGTGNVSKALLECGLKRLVLIEPDQSLFGVLQREIQAAPDIGMSNSTLAEYAKEETDQFDAFLYINVLEHIEHDRDELELIYSLLRPGGAALIFVPALQILFSENDRKVGHWRRYSKKELHRKLEQAGFEIREIRYFDFVGAFVWFFACKLLRLRPSAENVGFYDCVLVPFSRFIERICKPLFGKNLFAVAVKPPGGIV